MTPNISYLLYQIERPKSAAEIRRADEQIGQFAAAASGLFRSSARPGRLARAYRRLAELRRPMHGEPALRDSRSTEFQDTNKASLEDQVSA
jgi:hypothetical protein